MGSGSGAGPSLESNAQEGEASRRVPVHRRTYANARSYLAPIAALPSTKPSGIKMEESTSQVEDESTRESYADLTSRWGLDVEVTYFYLTPHSS